ncbi:hypothetical protein AGMMS50284_4730 [Clostridia bacterium]|nr:hypothetical protein AGMMS50284_4730 [Clostridia bacterium]
MLYSRNDKHLRNQKSFVPCSSMHKFTFSELSENYDYSKFPLCDTIHIDWNRDLEKMELHLPDNINSNSALAATIKRLQAVDIEIDKLAKENMVHFLCKKGCNNCCSEYYYVSMLEYFAAKNYLLNSNSNLFSACIKNGEKQFSKLKISNPNEYFRLMKINTKEIDFNDHENLERFEMCPFCDKKTKSCVIYPVRSIICKLYGTSYSYGYCNKITNNR